MIKAVLIDIDNTLLDFHLSVKDTLERVFKQFSIDFKTEYVPAFLRINDGLWRRIEEGTLTREGLFEIRFNTVFRELGIERDGAPIETAFRKELFYSAFPVQGAKEMLEYLSNKYTLYAASNAIYNQQIHRLEKAGMLKFFKDVFVSERIGYQKPTKEYFDYCFLRMDGISIKEAVIIGDSLTTDIKGGLLYGLTTVWYNHDKRDKGLDVKPHYTVDKLEDIKTIL